MIFTVSTVAAKLNVPDSTVHQLIKEGKVTTAIRTKFGPMINEVDFRLLQYLIAIKEV